MWISWDRQKDVESNVNYPVIFPLTNRPTVRGLCTEKWVMDLLLHCHEFTLVFGRMSLWRVYAGLLSPCAPALRTCITTCMCSFTIFWVSTPYQRLWQVLEAHRPIRGSPNPHRMYRSGKNRNLKFYNIRKRATQLPCTEGSP